MKKIIGSVAVIVLAITAQSFYKTNTQTNTIANGKKVYETYCQACHMEDGNGVEGAFPSLVKTGNLADKNRLVKIVLRGMRGPIVVKGVKYNAEMASINVTDQETADVINYIRNSWGNKAPLIKIGDISLAKKATVKGYQAY
jgi:mono/diheme cytochrome c family protein